MSYSIGLSKVRRSEAFLACAEILEEYGVEHRLEFGKKHPRIIVNVGGKELVHTLNWHCGEWNNAKNSALQLRRLIQEAQRGEEEDGIQGSEVMQATALVESNKFELSDLEVVCGHVRVRDLRLAERLGMRDQHAIRRVIDMHRQHLVRFGEIISEPDRKSGPGRPASSYYLNKKQAIYVTAKSNTPTAADITVQMVEVYDAFLNMRATGDGAIFEAAGLSPAVAKAVGGIVKSVLHKGMEETRVTNDLVLERVADLSARVEALRHNQIAQPTIGRDFITSFEVVQQAEVPSERRNAGLLPWITCQLRRASAQACVVPKLIPTFPGEKWAFDKDMVAHWLQDGGRKAIWVRVNEHATKRSGKTVVPLHRNGR